jgi:hypothetical protein
VVALGFWTGAIRIIPSEPPQKAAPDTSASPSIALADMTEAERQADAEKARAVHAAREKAVAELEAARPQISRPAYSAGMTDADVDRLTTYAVYLGRASACGVPSGFAVERVGAWIDAKMPPGSVDRQTLFPIFAAGMEANARMQSEGRSPDTCDQVREQFARMSWP